MAATDITVGGARQYVEVSGTGPPAVFLHGVPDSAALWAPVIAGVANRYTCYAPDLPGFRRSGLPQDFEFSLAGYAGFVERLLDALGIQDKVTLVAHDWGGIIGLAWACRHAERVRRVVAIDTVFSSRYRWHAWARAWRTPLLGEVSMLLMNRYVFRAELARGSRRIARGDIDAVWENLKERYATRFVILRLYRSLPPARFGEWEDALARLARLAPIDVLHGSEDPYIPVSVAEAMHAREVRIVAGCGHWVPVEAPEEVIALLAG